MNLLGTFTLTLVATICAAQDTPLGVTVKNTSCQRSIGGRYDGFYDCHKINYTNLSNRVIRGVKIVVDVVDAVGDKTGEKTITCCTKWVMKLKPAKTDKVEYSRYWGELYTNPRPIAVKFEDGTTWHAPEDKQRSD